MSIAVSCPACKAKFAAPDEAAGKTAHCTKCGCAITVPIPPRPLATEKQKEFARDLGIQFPDNIDRRAISELIDAAVAKQDEERFQRLDELEHREAAASEGLRLSEAMPDEMVKALYDRGLSAVLITMPTDSIVDFSHLKGLSGSISMTENMTRDDVNSVILTLAHPLLGLEKLSEKLDKLTEKLK